MWTSNLYLIEILEAIRLRTLLEQGLVRADAHNQNNSAPDVQQLGRTLSCSFYTVLEFANLSDFVVGRKYAHLCHVSTDIDPLGDRKPEDPCPVRRSTAEIMVHSGVFKFMFENRRRVGHCRWRICATRDPCGRYSCVFLDAKDR